MSQSELELVPLPKDAEVDIVFIPGLGQDRLGAWTADDDGALWPKEFLPTDFPKARILAFGYDASKTLENHADDLCEQLHRLRRNTETTALPIVLVARSLGGIVSAQVLVRGTQTKSGSAIRAICEKLHGMVFFGTPFQDSEKNTLSEIVKVIAGLCKLDNSELLKKELVGLQDTFPQALKKRADDNKKVGIVSFYEGRFTGKAVLVDESAATVPDHGSMVSIDDKHVNIGKFDDNEGANYGAMIEGLKSLLSTKSNRERDGSGMLAHSIGTYIGGNLNGGQHDRNEGVVNYGTVTTFNNHKPESQPKPDQSKSKPHLLDPLKW